MSNKPSAKSAPPSPSTPHPGAVKAKRAAPRQFGAVVIGAVEDDQFTGKVGRGVLTPTFQGMNPGQSVTITNMTREGVASAARRYAEQTGGVANFQAVDGTPTAEGGPTVKLYRLPDRGQPKPKPVADSKATPTEQAVADDARDPEAVKDSNLFAERAPDNVDDVMF